MRKLILFLFLAVCSGQELNQYERAVFGDGMWDRYWIGTANRLSPEFPGPVVKIEDMRFYPGGAGNVANNLQMLGVTVLRYFHDGPTKNRLMVGDTQIARWDEHDTC